jgi:hypothetical protein
VKDARAAATALSFARSMFWKWAKRSILRAMNLYIPFMWKHALDVRFVDGFVLMVRLKFINEEMEEYGKSIH